ncbi:cullin binding protein CanA [Cordyceps fumosorosea ARSEF 2679]|uniref:Cullin binding protein CanA n=1 Tax=Cordyceps fumosorosea (strain ARSEF 2679) TaxID=1081104 RepID=A0A168AT21_CORFA|nr:cullin binding protein CanA [Cordyceps fumosorosea ARSEF 2679]OAA69156.1 cullin binding protein CanA [Cordyceps fumosorosea ARSEF 2679]
MATVDAAAMATPQTVLGHVAKLNDNDPDFRFMALNDLLNIFKSAKHDFLQHDYNAAARTVDNIITTLDDQNGEVQSLAIKCLGPLVGKIPAALIAPMIDKLSTLKLKNSVDNSIPSSALRQVLIALPRPSPGTPASTEVNNAYAAISRVLIPRLVGTDSKTRLPSTNDKLDLPKPPVGLLRDRAEISVEAVDVSIEVVRCFGPLLSQEEVALLLNALMLLLEGQEITSVVKKRAVVAVSMLAVYVSDKQLENVIKTLTEGLARTDATPVPRRLYISILGSTARSIPSRLVRHLPRIVDVILNELTENKLESHLERMNDGDDLGLEFNDVREAALVALEALLASMPQEMRPFTDLVISSCLRYLRFDPNYAVDEDEEMEDDDEEEDEEDVDDEFDADDGFEDDDDDASWKVRRCAAKAIYTLIATRGSGDLLENGVLYSSAAPTLVKRVAEREENVRLEVISALSLLIRKTGEGLHTERITLDELEPDLTVQMPISRKRRRQSSGGGPGMSKSMMGTGLVSPVLEKAPMHGPRAELTALVPSVVKISAKQLKGKSIPTKQAIISLLDDVVSVLRGGLTDHFGTVISIILDAVKTTGSNSLSSSLATGGGTASATPSSLRVATLKLISDISKTHSSMVLQPYLTQIVDGVTSAVHDRFYKISSEAIRTSEELVKAITPPRSRGSAPKYKGELEKLYNVIMDRASANDADAEVRQRAIHGLGVMISRTSAADSEALLPKEKREAALTILRERLRNETARLAAVHAIDGVAASANTPGQLEKSWIQDVALELAAQLRKASRPLRGSSIAALKHLVLCKAAEGQLEANTIERVVAALMPTVKNADTHLLGPSLLILADLVRDHPQLVLTDEAIAALCELLKSHLAGIVLDQLLTLTSAVGESGVGGPLMTALLQNVSISGDAVVVGKVIGTLLVTGGSSSGVSVQSFVSELQTSSEGGDAARICLALAVLGEAGMRLGSKSPLKPNLFLGQFRAEPDKVSLAAAIALGRAGSGNVQAFLPTILQEMKNGGNTQYLLIQSIKEILQSVSDQSTDLRDQAVSIWDQLLQASDTVDNKVVCAECVGRLTTLDPTNFMPKLQLLLKASSTSVRGMAVQAVRYTLPECDEAFDAVLRQVLIDMLLTILQDKDTEIRRLAMTTLNSAAHNKPDLILPHLGQLMPFVLTESVVKPELVREVQLGPFKHTVDDGLEVRKSAYETLYALMETAFSRINNIDFYDRIIAGLGDDNDIRQLCNLMITKLIVIDPDETARRLDAIAEAYRSVLSTKLKENAVKQEIEKQEEANKSVLRVTILLGGKMKELTGHASAVTSAAGVSSVWTGYWEWANKTFESQLKSLREENRELQTRMV